MKILALSTATNDLTVAVSENNQILDQREETDQRNHSVRLDPLIQELLTANHLTLSDIDRFAVAVGPGSYTGLRIGVTTVKMFASILQKEVVPVSTLQALAANVANHEKLVVAGLDARNDNYFAGVYVNGKAVIPDGHYHIQTLLAELSKVWQDQELVFVGSGFEQHADLIKQVAAGRRYNFSDDNQLHAKQLALLAEALPAVDCDQLVPQYLRRTQAEIDWQKKTGQEFAPDSSYVEEV